MANDRGLLPKALDEHRRRQLARWYQNAYPDDNLFLTTLPPRDSGRSITSGSRS